MPAADLLSAPALFWTNFPRFVAICFFLLYSVNVRAVSLVDDRFTVFRGDVSGDGIEDLYLEHRDRFVIFKVSPVRAFREPSKRAYLLHGLADGRFAAPTLGRVATDTLQQIEAQYADFDGDGLVDLLITDSPGNLVLLGARPGDLVPRIIEQFDALGGRSVLAPSAVVTMQDLDEDGFADLTVRWGEGTELEFFNAGSGDWAFRDDPTFMTAVVGDIEPKFAVIGDSIAAGTHTSDMCGNRDIVDCLEYLGGRLSPEWGYASSNASWSIASRLGYDPAHVFNAADSGERWKDAFDQAVRVMDVPGVDKVLIGLGANDVCRDPGHNYGSDLAVIADHIDQTLGFLSDRMPAGGEIIMIGSPDVLQLRELMRARDHNIMFESCQATWDLNGSQIKDGAAGSACDHFSSHDFCKLIDNTEDAKDFIMRQLLDVWQDLEGVENGPCGKVLSRDATDTDRAEAAEFGRALNDLLANRALAFSGRNGIAVSFSDAVTRSKDFKPHHVSRFDCYHPSRAGQKFLADAVWSGMRPGAASSPSVHIDVFDNVDYCDSEARPWRTCWVERNDNDAPESGDVYIEGGRLRIKDNVRMADRGVDLGGASRAWLSFNARRKGLDRNSEAVIVELSANDGASWTEVTRIHGDGDDFGQQRGDYHQVSGFINAATMLRLRSERLGNNDEVQFDNVKLFSWSSPSPAGPPAVRDLTVDGNWQPVELAEALRLPVVLTGPISDRDGLGSLVELRNVARDAFDIHLLPFGADGADAPETVPVLALESGVYLPGDGSIWEVDSAPGGTGWAFVEFAAPFEQPPRLFLQIQDAIADPPVPRARNVSANGFELAVFGGTGASVGYLAVEGGEDGSVLNFADGERYYQTATETLTNASPVVLGATLGSRGAGGWLTAFTVEALRIGDHVFAREVSESSAPTVMVRLDAP